MADSLGSRLRNAWNAFNNRDQQKEHKELIRGTGSDYYPGYLSNYRPDRSRFRVVNEKSIVNTIYSRIAIDVASIKIKHVRVDKDDKYIEDVYGSELNQRLSLSANIDQTGRAFIQDIVQTLFEDGTTAIVPVDTDSNILNTASFDILSWRTGKVVEWYPRHVKLSVYNDRIGKREDILLHKEKVAIIENPLYSIMNEPNSTAKRLVEKLSLLDMTDKHAASGKLDLIIQLPYVIKSEARKQQADERRKDIQMQLQGSEYGIAYTDGTEKITQLNRAIESNLLPQIESLTRMLYNQLGLTEKVFNGTANESEMLNYQNRTLEPVLAAICDGMRRTFLTKTARTQGQSIKYFIEPFRLVPVSQLADIADKFTRNEIMSSNELRSEIGYRPVDDPRADELRNKNINQSSDEEIPIAEDDLDWEDQNGE